MDLKRIHDLFDSKSYRIWEGEASDGQTRCTVKELLADAASNPVFLDRLKEEAEFIEKFPHRHILALQRRHSAEIHFFEDTKYSLREFVDKNGKLRNEQVVRVLRQCLESLSFLHEQGFAHGSLCLENVFVDPEWDVKLADFVGYRFELQSPPPPLEGLPKHQPPEVVNGTIGQCGPSSDLYCLGFVALEMLSGPDFPNLFGRGGNLNDPQQWLRWHASIDTRLEALQILMPEVCHNLRILIEELIEKVPAKRKLKSATIALRRLNAMELDEEVLGPLVPVPPAPPPPPSQSTLPRRRLGPNLHLKPRSASSGLQEAYFPHDKPALFIKHEPADGDTVPRPMALLSCQENYWYIYNLSDNASVVLHNRKPVSKYMPRRLQSGDEIRFDDLKVYCVDLELQGTGINPHFDLIERIHSGQRGDIYRARLGRPKRIYDVAVKLLPEEFGRDVDQVRRFMRAVPRALKWRHPNIVPLFYAGRVRNPVIRSSPIWSLAFELMEGGSLRDKLSKAPGQRLGLQVCRRVAESVARALVAAQEHQIVHRNISPSCILFGARNQVKLGDFMLAKEEVVETFYDITRGKLIPGDYHYQSPEVLRGVEHVGVAADLYSLSVCLFEALTGSLPIDKNLSEASTITILSQFDWPLIRDFNPKINIPMKWQQFIAKNLSRNPSVRCKSAIEFLASLQSLPGDG